MKIALALIVKGVEEEADRLKECLNSVADEVDGIFITITTHDGEYHDRVEKVARLYDADVSFFEWENHFAKARNYNFSQVPDEYDYILWLDADDALRHPDKLKPTIKENPKDGYILDYLYYFDEAKNPTVVHRKTQIIKNDGSFKWRGRLHEDLEADRDVELDYIKGVERLHLTDEERVKENRERNLEIAREQMEKHPNDPRSYWVVGKALKGMEEYEEALDVFEDFLEMSESEDEKYLARIFRSECYLALDNKPKAIEEAQMALGMKPNLPDVYIHLGNIYLQQELYKKASELYLQGLQKKPQYHKMIVYNPREYDYVPMNNLAKCYFAMNRPDLALPLLKGCAKIYPDDDDLQDRIDFIEEKTDELEQTLKYVKELQEIEDKDKLKEALDDIPQDHKSHPVICNIRNRNFVKEESSGKDLVFMCGYTEREWNPKVAEEEGIGGSEEAVIHLSEIFAREGWNVTVYNNCGHKEKTYKGVDYKPFWLWNWRDKQDVTILWRTPKMAKYPINSDKVFVDLHDVISEGEFTKDRMENIDKIFVKSEFHRSLFENIDDDKFVIVPNGIDSEKFEAQWNRDEKLLINTSSPDRSLRAMLEAFPRIKEQVPEAKLKWAYGWGVWDTVHGDNEKMMEWKKEMQEKIEETEGFEALGMISHEEVRKLYLKANALFYPTEFAEIDCISVSKAQAGGAIPITSNFSALGEKDEYGVFIDSDKTKDTWDPPYKHDFSYEGDLDEFVEEAVKLLKNPPEERDKMREWARDKFDWDNVSEVWLNEF